MSHNRISHVLPALAVVLVLAATSAQGALLNFNMEPFPDIFSGYIDVVYTAATDSFVANGYTLAYYDGVTQWDMEDYLPDSFLIQATIDSSGNPVGGTLTLSGPVQGYGPTLLTADLTEFGWAFFDTLNPNSDAAMFDWKFQVTGGDMAGLYGGIGATVGTILSCVSVDAGVSETLFTADFNNNGGEPGWGSAVADSAPPVPEPLSAIVLIGGAVALLRRRAAR